MNIISLYRSLVSLPILLIIVVYIIIKLTIFSILSKREENFSLGLRIIIYLSNITKYAVPDFCSVKNVGIE
jgi:hypothetical protein